MPLPTDFKARKGDVLVLHATVLRNNPLGSIPVEIEGNYSTLYLSPECFEDVVRLAIEPGDRVWNRVTEEQGTVLAVGNEYAWIEPKCGGLPATMFISQLDRLPPLPEPDVTGDDTLVAFPVPGRT